MSGLNFLGEMAKHAANGYDDNGVAKFDEQKLRRELERNNKIGRRNRDVFMEGEVKFHTCPRYNPCPICDKCMNKASHLYVSCQTCNIPICAHKYQDREKMIKRKNFAIRVSPEIKKQIVSLGENIRANKYFK